MKSFTKKDENVKCSLCHKKISGNTCYLSFDGGEGEGVWLAFCSERHSDQYYNKKYQLPLPLEFDPYGNTGVTGGSE